MLDAPDLTSKPAYVDFMEAGAGSLVVLAPIQRNSGLD